MLNSKQGIAVDVSRPGQARVLADTAAAELGRVDIWWVQVQVQAHGVGKGREQLSHGRP